MESIEMRLRPVVSPPHSPVLACVAWLIAALTFVAFATSVFVLASVSNAVSSIEPVYDPEGGCEGLARPHVVRRGIEFPFHAAELNGSMQCQWEYDVLMNAQCFALQTRDLRLHMRPTSIQTLCQNNATSMRAVVGLATDDFQFSGASAGASAGAHAPAYRSGPGGVNLSYPYSLTCVFRSPLSMQYSCAPEQNNSVTTADVFGGMVCQGGFGGDGCVDFQQTVVLPGMAVDCLGEVAPLTPRFLCSRVLKLGWFSVASQAASAGAVAWSVLTLLAAYVIDACDQRSAEADGHNDPVQQHARRRAKARHRSAAGPAHGHAHSHGHGHAHGHGSDGGSVRTADAAADDEQRALLALVDSAHVHMARAQRRANAERAWWLAHCYCCGCRRVCDFCCLRDPLSHSVVSGTGTGTGTGTAYAYEDLRAASGPASVHPHPPPSHGSAQWTSPSPRALSQPTTQLAAPPAAAIAMTVASASGSGAPFVPASSSAAAAAPGDGVAVAVALPIR